MLTGGARDAPARQRTLRDAIAWSHDLLAPHEQTLFRRLAVFAGGCTLEAVEAINADGGRTAGGDGSLVDESLLREIEGPGDEPRFAMLETIREYGLERLEASGESGTVQERHATYFAGVAEALRPHLYGPDQGRTVTRLEAEQGNMRAALAWAIEHADAAAGLRLAANLGSSGSSGAADGGSRLAGADSRDAGGSGGHEDRCPLWSWIICSSSG